MRPISEQTQSQRTLERFLVRTKLWTARVLHSTGAGVELREHAGFGGHSPNAFTSAAAMVVVSGRLACVCVAEYSLNVRSDTGLLVARRHTLCAAECHAQRIRM